MIVDSCLPLHKRVHAEPNARTKFWGTLFPGYPEDETLVEVKERIQKKLQVPDEEFSKWKFAFLSLGRPEYLHDSDIVFNRFQRRDVYGAWEQYLGLEHSDNAPKRAYSINQDDDGDMRIKLERTEKELERTRTDLEQSQRALEDKQRELDDTRLKLERAEELIQSIEELIVKKSLILLNNWESVSHLKNVNF